MSRLVPVAILLATTAVAFADPEEVRAPVAADLAVYGKHVPGNGPLVAKIQTSLGLLHCLLFDKEAPVAVASFVGLATGQKPFTDPATGKVVRDKHFYDGLIFHRVIPEFMIQGGDPLGQGTGGPGFTFADETRPDVQFMPGALAMANAGPGTNGSQFFITDGETAWLQGKHTIFGQCAELAVVKKIASVPRDERDRPNKPVVIKKITFVRNPMLGRVERSPDDVPPLAPPAPAPGP